MISALLTGDMNRLRYVIRYSSIFTLHKENVAEHSYYVALYSLIIAEELNAKARNFGESDYINIRQVLSKAIMHDIEECRTGDIKRGFKHSSEVLNAAITQQAGHEVSEMLDDLCVESDYQLKNYWETAKDDTKEGKIVAFADFLSVLSYMLYELKASNETMWHQHDTMIKYLRKFDDPTYDFIRPYVDEANALAMEKLNHAR